MTSLHPINQEPSLAALIEMRTKTDIDLPLSWISIPLVNYVIWGICGIIMWSWGAGLADIFLQPILAGIGFVGLASSLASSYVIFGLVSRGNEHRWRSRTLAWKALGSVEGHAKASGTNALLPLNSAEDGWYNLARKERDRSAILFGLLCTIPFVGIIVTVIALWRLSRDLRSHSWLESFVIVDLDRTLRAMGLQGIRAVFAEIRAHDALAITILLVSIPEGIISGLFLGFSGALLLVYLTIGALSLFLIDLSFRDPINHFHAHSQSEADLLQSLPR